jgi:hypothetical protein
MLPPRRISEFGVTTLQTEPARFGRLNCGASNDDQ